MAMRKVFERINGKMQLVDYVYVIKNKRIVGKKMLERGGSGEVGEAIVEKVVEAKKPKKAKRK